MEENPWEVFESIFTPGSIHKGTISGSSDKGVIVTLPYGVEGFAPIRYLQKEDGTIARNEETLDFKVVEFSKENKKIILSHSRVYQDAATSQKAKEQSQNEDAEKSTKRAEIGRAHV